MKCGQWGRVTNSGEAVSNNSNQSTQREAMRANIAVIPVAGAWLLHADFLHQHQSRMHCGSAAAKQCAVVLCAWPTLWVVYAWLPEGRVHSMNTKWKLLAESDCWRDQKEDKEGTQRSKKQRWSHQEESGSNFGFSRYSKTLKTHPDAAKWALQKNFCNHLLLLGEIDNEREEKKVR